MFTHVVMFRLKETSKDMLHRTRDILLAMEGRIPELVAIEVGVDELHTNRSYDICLTTRFHSREDMEAYQVHPVHQDVLTHMREVTETSVAVDYSQSETR